MADQPTGADPLAGVHPQRLFAASCISLISTAVAFGVVTGFLPQLQAHFGFDNQQVGWVRGTYREGLHVHPESAQRFDLSPDEALRRARVLRSQVGDSHRVGTGLVRRGNVVRLPVSSHQETDGAGIRNGFGSGGQRW